MWAQLRDDVMRYGIYNQNLQAVPPTGSISYINHATSSIHPIVAKVEILKEGKTGREVYVNQDAWRRKDHRHYPIRAVADVFFPDYDHLSRKGIKKPEGRQILRIAS